MVPVKPHVSNLRGGQDLQKPIDHAEACSQNGNDRCLLPAEALADGCAEGRGDLVVLQLEAAGGLVHHEEADLPEELPELLRAGCDAAEEPDLVLDERVVEDSEAHFFPYKLSTHSLSCILFRGALAVRCGITASMTGFHPVDPGSIPGIGALYFPALHRTRASCSRQTAPLKKMAGGW